jgi:hypothetical protein
MNSVVLKSAAEDGTIRPSTSVEELESNRYLHRRKSHWNGDSSRSRSHSRSRSQSRVVTSFFGDTDDNSDDMRRENSAIEIAKLRAEVKELKKTNAFVADMALDTLTPSHAPSCGQSTERRSTADGGGSTVVDDDELTRATRDARRLSRSRLAALGRRSSEHRSQSRSSSRSCAASDDECGVVNL